MSNDGEYNNYILIRDKSTTYKAYPKDRAAYTRQTPRPMMPEVEAMKILKGNIPGLSDGRKKRKLDDDEEQANYSCKEPRHLKNLCGSFICSFQHLRRLVASLDHHHQFCTGRTWDRTREYTLCGLVAKVKFHCELKGGCKAWVDGTYTFESDDYIKKDGCNDYASNIKLAAASVFVPGLRLTHSKMFL